MRAGPAGTLLACVTALFGMLGSCAQQGLDRVAVDPSPLGVHRIFVLGHGYHTGLVVHAREVPEAAWPARRDLPDAEYLELGWGDREYYPRAILIATYALTDPDDNINWVFMPERMGWWLPELAWMIIYMMAVPVVVHWPLHKLYSRYLSITRSSR